MEIKAYLRILGRYWWLVVLAFVVTLTATIVLTWTQEPVYESSATFIVAPKISLDDVRDFVDGLEVLSRRAEIASTYAQVASSRRIKEQAANELGLSPEQKESLRVNGQLLAGTNVLEITVEGNDPALVRDFANMVGAETLVYAEELYEAYELNLLDNAAFPSAPIRPNKPLNLSLGVVFGLVLGAGLAFSSEYLVGPTGSTVDPGIADESTDE